VDLEGISTEARALRRKTHQTIAKITGDFDQLHLNTSVAALMELFNQLSEFNADPNAASRKTRSWYAKRWRRWLLC
jgi:leucyl-tRNA synthetase